MSKKSSDKLQNEAPASQSRRRFLSQSAQVSAGALLGAAAPAALAEAAKTAEPLAVPLSNRVLGSGVVSTPYGLPSKFESEVLRRNVDWLTPDRIASISFSPLQDLHGS